MITRFEILKLLYQYFTGKSCDICKSMLDDISCYGNNCEGRGQFISMVVNVTSCSDCVVLKSPGGFTVVIANNT